jgi:hypothetical protein
MQFVEKALSDIVGNTTRVRKSLKYAVKRISPEGNNLILFRLYIFSANFGVLGTAMSWRKNTNYTPLIYPRRGG